MSVSKQKQKKQKKNKFSYSKMILAKESTGHYRTPLEAYEALNSEFHFTVKDPAKSANLGKRVFVNSYSDPNFWVTRVLQEIQKGHTQLGVLLLKDDISTVVWHDYILPFVSELRAVRGRLKFGQSQKGNAPFGSIVAIFRAGPRIAKFKNLDKEPEKKLGQKKGKPTTGVGRVKKKTPKKQVTPLSHTPTDYQEEIEKMQVITVTEEPEDQGEKILP